MVLGAVEPLAGKQAIDGGLQAADKKEYTAFMQQLAARFDVYYTVTAARPKCGSWLNMIELEFSALSRKCLNRRIVTQEELEKQVLAAWAGGERQG